MINIKIDVQDENEVKLKELEQQFPGITDAGLRAVSREFHHYVIGNYLSGQVFGIRTGKLIKDTHYGKNRKATHSFEVTGAPRVLNIFSHPGGANIWPIHKTVIDRQQYSRVNSKGRSVTGWRRKRTRKEWRDGFIKFPNQTGNPAFGEFVFLRHAHLQERRVMEPAAAHFDFTTSFQRHVERLAEKAFRKRDMEIR